MILAGDLGGTKCTLILFDINRDRLRPIYRLTAKTAGFRDIESFFDNFREHAKREGHLLNALSGAGFGVAGAIVNDEVLCNNLPWTITRNRLAQALKITPARTMLLNDVESAASSLEHLEKEDLLELNSGAQQLHAPKVYVAAGTGLGESILFWNGNRYQVSACEAGLTDFAPGTDREIVVLQALRQRMPLVCTEEIVSGRGFRAIHQAIFPEVIGHVLADVGGQAVGAHEHHLGAVLIILIAHAGGALRQQAAHLDHQAAFLAPLLGHAHGGSLLDACERFFEEVRAHDVLLPREEVVVDPQPPGRGQLGVQAGMHQLAVVADAATGWKRGRCFREQIRTAAGGKTEGPHLVRAKADPAAKGRMFETDFGEVP